MCRPKVFKAKINGDWAWNCLEHSKVVREYENCDVAISAAELHVMYHDGMITETQLIETTITKIEMQGNPRLVHLFDQFYAEVKKGATDVNTDALQINAKSPKT